MKDRLLLNELLNLTSEELLVTKVRLNTYNGKTNPIDEFKKNPEELLNWNYWNNKSYRKGQISIGLVYMGDHKYLLFTIGRIINILDKAPDFKGVAVEYETLEKYQSLYGRVVIKYQNHSQQLFRNADGIINDLEIVEILPSIYSGFDFPGYDNVHLTYDELRTIVNGNYPSYKNALENQKAVYLQTDTLTGKLYVGSATSDNGMLLARWRSYIECGHGGNVGLKELIEVEGFDYIKNNFTYTIIENFNARTPDEYVLERESYWKTVLNSRKTGYNKN